MRPKTSDNLTNYLNLASRNLNLKNSSGNPAGDPVNMVPKLMLKIQKFCSKMRFLGVILHEKQDFDAIFMPNASEIVKMSVF